MNLNQVKRMLNSEDLELRKQAESYLSDIKSKATNTKNYMSNNISKTGESINHLITVIVIGIFLWVIFSTINHNTNPPQDYNAGEVNSEAQIDVQLPKVQPLNSDISLTGGEMPKPPEPVDPLAKIKAYLKTRENRYTDDYLNRLYNSCNKDVHLVRLYVAISGQESSFGTRGHANDGKGADVNYIGLMHWPNGVRKIRDISLDDMISETCRKFTDKNQYFNSGIITRNGDVANWANVKAYTGNDRPQTWANNVTHFYKAMM